MSTSVSYTQNGLNVHYFPNFFETKEADEYFIKLKELSFFTPTYKIRGRTAKPKRQMLAYGDDDTSYAFSGTRIEARPWTPLILQLREHVERHYGCAFNYVLLNKYVNGSDYISQHKDNETVLNSTFPIVVLSFGVERTIEFKKPKEKCISIRLRHGSLYRMEHPTNKHYTHGIPVEPLVQGMRISLTFRHLIMAQVPTKKLKLTPSSESSSNDSTNNEHSNTGATSTETNRGEHSHDQGPRDFASKPKNVVLTQWDLLLNTRIQVVMQKNLKIRVYIRKFLELPTGECKAIREAITITPQVWFSFQKKICKLQFRSSDESFICQNQLVLTCVNEEFCLIQQMSGSNTEGFFLKPTVLKLTKNQIFQIVKLSYEITESIIEGKLTKLIPSNILRQPFKCENHSTLEKVRENYLNFIMNEIKQTTEYFFECEMCCERNFADNQLEHECLNLNIPTKFCRNREEILLNLDCVKIAFETTKECNCFFNEAFFKTYNKDFFQLFIFENI